MAARVIEEAAKRGGGGRAEGCGGRVEGGGGRARRRKKAEEEMALKIQGNSDVFIREVKFLGCRYRLRYFWRCSRFGYCCRCCILNFVIVCG